MILATSTSPARATFSVSLALDSAELASTYERVGTRQFEHGKLLIAALAPRPGERVLDIGCGTGRLGDYVAELIAPDGAVVGIDPLPHRHRRAQEPSLRGPRGPRRGSFELCRRELRRRVHEQ